MFNIRFADLTADETRALTESCPLVLESPSDYTDLVRQANGVLDAHYCPRDLDMLLWLIGYLHQQRKCPDQGVSHPIRDCLRLATRACILCELAGREGGSGESPAATPRIFACSEKDLARILDNRFQTLLASALLPVGSPPKEG